MLSTTASLRESHPHPQGLIISVWIAAEIVILVFGILFSPAYVLAAFVGICWVIGCFSYPIIRPLAIALVVASPFFLYLDRVQSIVVVGVLIGGAFLVALLSGASIQLRSRTAIDSAALAFTAYMALNCAWGIYRGNNSIFAVNDLLPVVEMYACYWLAVRTRFSQKSAQRLVYLLLALVAARGAWQILLFLTGKAGTIVPPVFDNPDSTGINILGSWFVRLFDPIQALFVAPAVVFFLVLPPEKLRRLSVITLTVGVVALVLSFERAEWIATIVCVAGIVYFARKRTGNTLRRVALAFGAVSVALLLISRFFEDLSLSLDTILSSRLIDYTQQQVFDPRNSLQMVRLLEYGTAKTALLSSPLFGHGLGRGLGTVVSNGFSLDFVPIHNYFLNLLATAGLVGAVLLLYLAVQVAKTLLARYRSASDPFDRGFILSSMAGMVWYAIFISFHPVYSAYHIPALLGIYVGAAVSFTGGIEAEFPRRNLGRSDFRA